MNLKTLRIIKHIFIAFTFVSVLLISSYMYVFKYSSLDAMMRVIAGPFVFTEWSQEFSEEKFSEIKIGMHKKEILELLGPPLSEICNEEDCSMRYTNRENDDLNVHFDVRWLLLSADGVVTEIQHYFWFD